MHNEKNNGEALFHMFFDIKDKTKDNVQARLDQEKLCNRPLFNMYQNNGKWKKPQADYCLTREQRKEV
jgi:hypothetical protein